MRNLLAGRMTPKKIVIALIAGLTAFMMLSGAVFAAGTGGSGGAPTIVEVPDRKIILEGTPVAFKDVPIAAGGRTLLPLRELVTALGVPNDDEHIMYRRVSDKEQHVTVIYGETRIELTIGKTEAYVNGEKLVLDVAPVIYKNRTYIPLRFVAEALGKKVAWAGETNTVLIIDQKTFDAVREIIIKSNEASNKVTKNRMKMELTGDITVGTMKTTMGISVDTAVDKKSKAMYIGMVFDFLGFNIEQEGYYKDNVYYAPDILTGTWKKKTYTPEEYDRIFETNSDSVRMEDDEKLLACLTIAESENEDELVLVGNTNFMDIFSGSYMQQAGSLGLDDKSMQSEWYSVKFVFYKDTYMLKAMSMEMHGEGEEDGVFTTIDMKVTTELSDFNGDFEITVPEEAVKNAVEDDSIDSGAAEASYSF